MTGGRAAVGGSEPRHRAGCLEKPRVSMDFLEAEGPWGAFLPPPCWAGKGSTLVSSCWANPPLSFAPALGLQLLRCEPAPALPFPSDRPAASTVSANLPNLLESPLPHSGTRGDWARPLTTSWARALPRVGSGERTGRQPCSVLLSRWSVDESPEVQRG